MSCDFSNRWIFSPVTKVLHEIKLVTGPRSENRGDKLSGRSNKTSIHSQCQLSVVKMHPDIVLPWLSYDGTLSKEFEKNKVGNIRLRAVPVED